MLKNVIINFIVFFICIMGFSILADMADDPPAGYTSNYKLRYWDEGDHPSGDSVNQNLIDIDNHIKNRDRRIDSLKTAYEWMFNFPTGTFKRYDSNEFDNDTLKVKSGVFPKLATANTFSQNQTLSSSQTNFGTTTHTLNFNIDNDQGGIVIKKNNSTDLLKWDEQDGLYWQLLANTYVDGDVDITGDYKINGVPIGSGGGDVFEAGRNVFSDLNTFSDSVKFDGRNNFTDYNLFSDTVAYSQDLYVANNKKIHMGNYSSYPQVGISSQTNMMLYTGFAHFFNTTSGSNTILTIDSIAGIDLSYGDLKLSSGRTVKYNGSSLQYFDSANVGFNNTANDWSKRQLFQDSIRVTGTSYFTGVVTFLVSPVYSALVTFAYGITVQGTATFNGDIENNGWREVGGQTSRIRYARDTVLTMVLTGSPGVAQTFSINHGISNWRGIIEQDFIIHEDSLDINVQPGIYPNAAQSVQTYLAIAWTDATTANIRLKGSATEGVNLFNDTCTIFIKYTDYSR